MLSIVACVKHNWNFNRTRYWVCYSSSVMECHQSDAVLVKKCWYPYAIIARVDLPLSLPMWDLNYCKTCLVGLFLCAGSLRAGCLGLSGKTFLSHETHVSCGSLHPNTLTRKSTNGSSEGWRKKERCRTSTAVLSMLA